eukprot:m.158590 g.158590  ORF g.158590 m.158590 type:complete len:57 (+) comp17025_c1_seq3:1099-1269(+)
MAPIDIPHTTTTSANSTIITYHPHHHNNKYSYIGNSYMHVLCIFLFLQTPPHHAWC